MKAGVHAQEYHIDRSWHTDLEADVVGYDTLLLQGLKSCIRLQSVIVIFCFEVLETVRYLSFRPLSRMAASLD